jgi:polar amino acid transport system substrate-binding protein
MIVLMCALLRPKKWLFLSWMLSACWPVVAVDLTAYTEEWPPYSYAQGGEITGVSTDILREACALAKLECAFHLVPWARAYKTAKMTPNTVVYTTARKTAREKEFLWVGPLLPRTTWVYVRGGLAAKIGDFQSLAHHRVGVVRDEAAQADLVAAGIPLSAITPQSSNAEVLRMLGSDLVDAMVDTEIGMAWNLQSALLSPSTVVRKMKLTDEGAYYFALNLETDPAMVRGLQTAVDKLRRSGRIDAIVRQYAMRLK